MDSNTQLVLSLDVMFSTEEKAHQERVRGSCDCHVMNLSTQSAAGTGAHALRHRLVQNCLRTGHQYRCVHLKERFVKRMLQMLAYVCVVM